MLELHEQLSEFSYGYGVTRGVESALQGIGVRSVPFLPSLVQEGELGFDVKFDKPGAVLMLQFKLGQCLSRFRRRNPTDRIPSPLARPFWRFKIDTADPEGQFVSLHDSEMSGAEVYYVSPRFSGWEDYSQAYKNNEVVERSLLITPREIYRGSQIAPAANGLHYVVYDDIQNYVCSEPVPVHSVRLPEIGERLRSKITSGETLGATLHRMFEAVPHLDRPDLRSDVAVSRKRENRSVFLQRIRSRARSEDDAIATVVAAENWIKGALTLFVGQPNDDEAS
jgi:hypothetical protein